MTATFVSEDAALVETGADSSDSTATDACSVPAAVDSSDEATDPEDDDDAVEDDGEASPVVASGRLTGAALLAKLKELGDAGKSDLVRACGYVTTKKDGTERLNFSAFYEATLAAKGLNISSPGVTTASGEGRKLSYKATVQGNGNLMIGKAYTALLDLKPGDEFEIKLGRKQIRLVPAGEAPDSQDNE